MPRANLTPSFVEKAKAQPGAERTVYWDEGLEGFGLMVTPAGHKSFVCQYRVGHQSRRYTIKGVLNLGAARKEAKGVLGAAAKGRDPLAERRKAAGEATNTLKAIGDDYLEREGKRLRSIDQRRDVLERLVYPKFGTRQIDTIRRSEIVSLLDKIEDNNGPVMADHTLATLRRLFNWHAARSDDFLTPIRRGMARTKPQDRKRQRTLTDDELRAVWNTAAAGTGPFDYMLRFILLTATRRNEAAQMRRAELDGSNWLIPAARSKSKADFLLPLSTDAAKVLAEVPALGKVFTFTTDGKRALGGYSKFKRDFDKRCGVTGWTIHDLRRTARSLMSRAGVSPDVAERCLGHVIGGVRGVYDVHSYLDEKRAAFEALAAQIGRILNPPADNVVQLHGAA